MWSTQCGEATGTSIAKVKSTMNGVLEYFRTNVTMYMENSYWKCIAQNPTILANSKGLAATKLNIIQYHSNSPYRRHTIYSKFSPWIFAPFSFSPGSLQWLNFFVFSPRYDHEIQALSALELFKMFSRLFFRKIFSRFSEKSPLYQVII